MPTLDEFLRPRNEGMVTTATSPPCLEPTTSTPESVLTNPPLVIDETEHVVLPYSLVPYPITPEVPMDEEEKDPTVLEELKELLNRCFPPTPLWVRM